MCAKRDPKSYDQEIRSLLDGAGSGPGFIFKGVSVVSLPGRGGVLSWKLQPRAEGASLCAELQSPGKLAWEAQGRFLPPAEGRFLLWPSRGFQGHPGTHRPISVLVTTGCLIKLLGPLPSREQHGLGSEESRACMPVGWVTPHQDLTSRNLP